MSSTDGFKGRAKDLVHEGNARHVIVEKDGRVVVDLSLTIVIISALLAVWLVAVLAAVAVLSGCDIRIEGPDFATKRDDSDPQDAPTAGDGRSAEQ